MTANDAAPRTAAGRALLADYYANNDAREGVGYSLGDRILAIEAEARAALAPAESGGSQTKKHRKVFPHSQNFGLSPAEADRD